MAHDLLVSLHCNLDDGGLNEACRDIQLLRGMESRGELTADQLLICSSRQSMQRILAACLGETS